MKRSSHNLGMADGFPVLQASSFPLIIIYQRCIQFLVRHVRGSVYEDEVDVRFFLDHGRTILSVQERFCLTLSHFCHTYIRAA